MPPASTADPDTAATTVDADGNTAWSSRVTPCPSVWDGTAERVAIFPTATDDPDGRDELGFAGTANAGTP